MLDKTIYMVGGLPRSGSTLLMNILGQNPDFYVTPTSGMLDGLSQIKSGWDKNSAHRAMDRSVSDQKKLNTLRSMLQAYFMDVEQPICFDKNRGWPAQLEFIEALLGSRERVRLLITVRDLRDVLASFERLHRKTVALGQTSQDVSDPKRSRTAAGRMEIMIEPESPVGWAFNAIRDAFTRGWADCIYIVEYDSLTSEPEKALEAIYQFLEQPVFKHDFEHVEQITQEDDLFHGFKDLHKVRQQVLPQKPQWPEVFDQTVMDEPVWKKVEEVCQFWRAYQNS